MKTTIKVGDGASVIVEPLPNGLVAVTVNIPGLVIATALDESACGALIFGIEQALDAMGMMAMQPTVAH